jgi:hypothetical protein
MMSRYSSSETREALDLISYCSPSCLYFWKFKLKRTDIKAKYESSSAQSGNTEDAMTLNKFLNSLKSSLLERLFTALKPPFSKLLDWENSEQMLFEGLNPRDILL